MSALIGRGYFPAAPTAPVVFCANCWGAGSILAPLIDRRTGALVRWDTERCTVCLGRGRVA